MENTKTQEQQILELRDTIVNFAIDNEHSFNVVFAALSQVTAAFLFDFILLTDGELTEDAVIENVERYSNQLADTAAAGFDSIAEHARNVAEPSRIILAS